MEIISVYHFFTNAIDRLSVFVAAQLSEVSLKSVFIVLIFYFLISFFLLIISVFVIKIIANLKERRDCSFRDICRRYIQHFIDGKNDLDTSIERLSIADTHHKRNLLIEEIMLANRSRSAATRMLLLQLYRKMNLDQQSIKKLSSVAWHVKIKGFHELAEMKIKDANKKILKFTSSKNQVLRTEAELSSIRLLPFVPFAFLDSIERHFSLLEQINVYELIKLRDIEIPEFSLWLNSPNPWVVNYALNMIRVLKQKSAQAQIIELYANTSDPTIRNASLHALCALGEIKEVELFINNFMNESNQNKKAIITLLRNNHSEISVNFLIQQVCEKDFVLRKTACESLMNNGNGGIEHLHRMKDLYDEELKRIVAQLLHTKTTAA